MDLLECNGVFIMNIRCQKGVTLVELVTALAIFAIIITPISMVFNIGYSRFFKESDNVIAQEGARQILYGNGINSNGIMGDLARCNNLATTTSGIGILIGDDASNLKSYIFDYINKKLLLNGVNYFDNTDKEEVQVTSFSAITIDIGQIIDGNMTDTKVIKVYAEVSYGKSNSIKLSNSYRLPKIEN